MHFNYGDDNSAVKADCNDMQHQQQHQMLRVNAMATTAQMHQPIDDRGEWFNCDAAGPMLPEIQQPNHSNNHHQQSSSHDATVVSPSASSSLSISHTKAIAWQKQQQQQQCTIPYAKRCSIYNHQLSPVAVAANASTNYNGYHIEQHGTRNTLSSHIIVNDNSSVVPVDFIAPRTLGNHFTSSEPSPSCHMDIGAAASMPVFSHPSSISVAPNTDLTTPGAVHVISGRCLFSHTHKPLLKPPLLFICKQLGHKT